jgi:hypothetical protein
MPRFPFSRALATLASLFLALVATAAPKWNTLQAPHCLIVSQLSERETRDWATQFEQFTAALRSKITIDDRFLPPLTVVLFADSGKFAPYCPRTADGKKRNVAGFFASRDTWGVIGLADAFNDEETRHVVLHEATHWLISATRTEIPLWLNEGFAEVFSTFQFKKDYGLLGEPIPYHLDALRGERWVPLFQLMLTSAGDNLYTDNNRNRIFYAESWVFTHKLLFENPAAGYKILNTFFKARIGGADQLSSFQTAFDKDMAIVEEELGRYANSGKFTFTKLPLPPEAKVTTPFTPAAPQTVEIALARLALGAQRRELARTHIEKAVELDPAAAAPHELLAMLESGLKNNDAAFAAATTALDHGSRDAWAHILVAQTLWQRHADSGTLESAAREIAGHYAEAIELQPNLRGAYQAYANLVQSLPSMTQADATILSSGYKIYPDATELLVGIAIVLHKGHNDSEANHVLGFALAHADRLPQEQRSNAERLRTEWKIDPLARRIAELEKQKLYGEALAECEKLLQEPMQMNQQRFWEKRRTELRFQVALAEAQQAEHANEPEEALRLTQALVANPEFTQNQLTFARRYLEYLRKRLPHPADSPTP